MAQINLGGGNNAYQEPLLDNNTDFGGGLESQRRRQIGDAYRNYSGGQNASEDIYQRFLRNGNYDAEIRSMFQQPQGNSGGGNGGIFTDPGASRWETANNAVAQHLMTPSNNPDFQPYIDYMRQYFKQLQQPGYTPAQQDLIQTQALDPLERQRQATRQQITERMAAKGIQGGLVERAIENADQAFNQQRTSAQSNFATQQITMDQQRAQQATQVGAALAQAQQAMQSNDENRMLQALTLMFQIPQYADTRMMNANQVLQPLNAGSIAGMLNSANANNANANNMTNANNSNYMSQIMAMLAGLFR